MDAVLRAAAVYAFLLVVLRLAGRHGLGRLTAFDFVLLLILGEAVQQSLLGQDFSIIRAVSVVAVLAVLQAVFASLRGHMPVLDRWAERVPIVVVADGRCLPDQMRQAGIDERDLLEAARRSQGLERLDEVRHAVVEVCGAITIIPRQDSKDRRAA